MVTARRVLVVDDHPMNVTIASEVLLVEGFEVDSAEDAVEAMQKIVSFRPELILMDIQLPGTDGLELTRQIKADPSLQHIVIVAFTAFAMRGDEEKMRAAGCDGYISKPIEVSRFGEQVRALLEAAPGSAPGAT